LVNRIIKSKAPGGTTKSTKSHSHLPYIKSQNSLAFVTSHGPGIWGIN
jgi:hypothetical protein